MATNAAAGASRQLASARTATAVWKKYTVQSHGVWERIRRALAVDPNRSTGVPLNPQYRNSPPGANPPEAYDDPVTVPSGDIAENAYYKRDIRRSYPRLSVVKQADVVGLLSVGSKANPKEDVLQIGDAGEKQLIQVKQEGDEKGLAALFEREKNSIASIFGPDGLPPFPSGMSRASPVGGRKYVMDADREQGYPEDIYADDDGNLGLRKGGDPHNDRISKLWLTECAHLTCGKHLEGGGAPFHADEQVPCAPCPLCTLEKNDHTKKSLFFVNGISKGEYDKQIPHGYFQIPPKGDAAQTFQYVSLIRYGLKTAERAYQAEAALRQWEEKKAEIVRSLSTVAPLRNELIRAGQRLLSLGQDISSTEATLNSVGTSLAVQSVQQQRGGTQQNFGHHGAYISPSRTPLDVGSRLAQGSAADLDALSQGKNAAYIGSQNRSTQPDLVEQNGSSLKRRRAESLSDVEQQMDDMLGGKRYQKSGSRDQMPPPPIPMQQSQIFTVRNPHHGLNETSPRNGGDTRLQAERGPVTPHQRNPSDLSRTITNSRGNLPTIPSAIPNIGGSASPYGLRAPSPRMPEARRPPLDRAFLPSIAAYYNEGSDRSVHSEPPTIHPIGDLDHRDTRTYNGSLHFSPNHDNRAVYPNTYDNRSTSRLGLSGNARSSGYTMNQTPPSSNHHRRPLGQGISASPHFLPRRLSNSISMSSLRGHVSSSMSRTNSYSSTTTTLVGSREREDLLTAPGDLTSDRGRNNKVGLGAPNLHRLDPSPLRLPTAQAEVSAQRRRANR